jgi:hypothetical protein
VPADPLGFLGANEAFMYETRLLPLHDVPAASAASIETISFEDVRTLVGGGMVAPCILDYVASALQRFADSTSPSVGFARVGDSVEDFTIADARLLHRPRLDARLGSHGEDVRFLVVPVFYGHHAVLAIVDRAQNTLYTMDSLRTEGAQISGMESQFFLASRRIFPDLHHVPLPCPHQGATCHCIIYVCWFMELAFQCLREQATHGEIRGAFEAAFARFTFDPMAHRTTILAKLRDDPRRIAYA